MCADGNRKSNGGEGEYMGEISVKAKDLISRRSSTSSASSSVELLMKKWWKLVDEGGVGDVTGEIDIGFSYKHVKTSEGNRVSTTISRKHLCFFLLVFLFTKTIRPLRKILSVFFRFIQNI